MTEHMVNFGDLAYADSFAGLLPCKVLGWDDGNILVKITANRSSYRKGEIVDFPPTRIAARTSVRIRSGQYRIIGRTTVAES